MGLGKVSSPEFMRELHALLLLVVGDEELLDEFPALVIFW